MSEPDEAYDRIQTLRINNLEHQVQSVQRELQRLRDGIWRRNDREKLHDFKEKLKQLNSLLTELRTFYNSMQQSYPNNYKNTAQSAAKENAGTIKHNLEEYPENTTKLVGAKSSKGFARENAGLDQAKSFIELSEKEAFNRNAVQRQDETANSNDPFKTCKQLMAEIKSPGSILGKYLTKLQDFRADPELRRQRWERKQQQILQQHQTRNGVKPRVEDKATATEENEIFISNGSDENSCYIASPRDVTAVPNAGLFPTNKTNDTSCNSQCAETGVNLPLKAPIISTDLTKTIEELIKDADKAAIVLTFVLENDGYHVSISHLSDGEKLVCFRATAEAVQEAKYQHLFQKFLTFFVVDAENSKSQKDQILGHLFEFIKVDSKNAIDEDE